MTPYNKPTMPWLNGQKLYRVSDWRGTGNGYATKDRTISCAVSVDFGFLLHASIQGHRGHEVTQAEIDQLCGQVFPHGVVIETLTKPNAFSGGPTAHLFYNAGHTN